VTPAHLLTIPGYPGSLRGTDGPGREVVFFGFFFLGVGGVLRFDLIDRQVLYCLSHSSSPRREEVNYLKVFVRMCDSDLFSRYFHFSPLALARLQFGPFLDAKHEQVEVSPGDGVLRRPGYLHLVKSSLLFSFNKPVANQKHIITGHFSYLS
jgi:hypothetical protein